MFFVDHVWRAVGDCPVEEPVGGYIIKSTSFLDFVLLLVVSPVVIERHFARAFKGNSSPVTTHATGPHELAKKKM